MGGSVTAEGLGDGRTHGKVTIAKLRLTLPPREMTSRLLSAVHATDLDFGRVKDMILEVLDVRAHVRTKADALSEGETMKRRGPFPLVLLAFLFTFATVGSIFASDSAYTFSFNGRPVTPEHYSLNGDASVFAPGDVIYVGDEEFAYKGLFLTLGDEKQCRFVGAPLQRDDDRGEGNSASRTPVSDGRIFLELPNGSRKVVGVMVTWTFEKADGSGQQAQDRSQASGRKSSTRKITINPLDSMSPEEIHGLWGIFLNEWPEGIEQRLAYVNTDRVCIALTDYAGRGSKPSRSGAPVFPPLPSKVRYLVVRSPGMYDYSGLSQFRNLLFVKFQWSPSQPLDAGLICQNASMRYLDLSGCGIPNYSKLGSLTDLRFLNISRCRDIENLEFVKDMRQLRSLYAGFTKISSLSPLDNSDSIREIYAGMTAVRVLPKGGLGSLRAINLVSSKANARAVERFREDHPACAVQYGWVDSLRQAVQGATRLRVRSGGTCHRRIEEEKTLIEVTEAQEIERVLKAIDIDESQSGGACACCGSPTFEFYAGERLLAMVGYHHGERLRWAGGEWTGDGELTGSSATFLKSWLSQHGVGGPRREVEARQKQQDEEARRQRRYAELIPQPTLAAAKAAESSSEISWRNDTLGEKRKKLVADAFTKHEQGAKTSVELYLRMLGVTREEAWNSYDYFDDVVVKHLLPRFKGGELAQGGLAVITDEEGMAGAARWFLGENGWRNLNETDRERILRPLAQQALQHRYMDTRKRVMNVLCDINTPWAMESLRSMLSWPTDPKWMPPKVKYGWRIGLIGGGEVCSDECSDAVWAAFCLAKMGNSESLPALQKLAEESQGPDKDLLNKAIQLLREKGSGR
jgi:hypothetical protein